MCGVFLGRPSSVAEEIVKKFRESFHVYENFNVQSLLSRKLYFNVIPG